MNDQEMSTPVSTPMSAPTASGSFPGPVDTLQETWVIYKSRFKTFAMVMLLPMVLIIIMAMVGGIGAGILGVVSGSVSMASGIMMVGILAVIFIVIIMIFYIWAQAALVVAIQNSGENMGVKESYRKAKRFILPFFLTGILMGLIIMGGFFFFIIPGIIFSVWFMFATYIIVIEDKKYMGAMLASREYVRGRWWGILGRLLFMTLLYLIVSLLLNVVLSIIPFLLILASPIAMLFLTPFMMTYVFVLYKNLKALHGGSAPAPKKGTGTWTAVITILGWIMVPLFIGGIIMSVLNKQGDLENDILYPENTMMYDESDTRLNLDGNDTESTGFGDYQY